MNVPGAEGDPQPQVPQTVQLEAEQVRTMRRCLHELANVFTGMMIAGGLLAQYLEGGSLESYVIDMNLGSERGSVLVRQLRSTMLAACGEAEPTLAPRRVERSQ